MRLFINFIVFITILSTFAGTLHAADRYAVASGNWNATSTWATSHNGTPGASVPTTADRAIIDGGRTVTVNTTGLVCQSLSLGGLNATEGAGTINFSASSQLAVSGLVTIGRSPTRTGSINMTNGGTFVCQGFTLNNGGTWTPGIGTVELTVTNTLPTSWITSFYNLTVAGGTTTLGRNISVSGVLTQTGGNIAVGANTLTVNSTHDARTYTVSGAGGYALASGATLMTANTSGINGSITATTRTLNTAANYTFNGASSQVTGTYLPTTVNNLTLNNTNGATLSGSVTVNGTLTLSNGRITTGANNLIVSSSGSVSGAGAGKYIYGNLRKVFPTGAQSFNFAIGDVTNYTPVALSFANVTTSGNVTASTVATEHPNISTSILDNSKSVNRYWTLTNGGVAFTTYDATFTFVAGDVDAGASTSNFSVGQYLSSAWSSPTIGTRTSTSTQVTGVSSFGDFAIGERKTYSITAAAGTGGTISPSGTVTVTYGNNQSFSITADANYHISDVLVDAVSQGAISSYTFTNVTAAHTIGASFAINTYTIVATGGANGTITPSGTMTYNEGGSQSFAISANLGYHIDDVLVDGSSVGAVTSYDFNNIVANHTISVSFAINPAPSSYIITATAGANGTIDPLGAVIVLTGDDQQFSVTPDAGYHITDVLVDGSSQGAISTYTFTSVTDTHTISAGFAINTYTLAVNALNGTVAKNPDQATYDHGTNVELTATPSAGYHFANWSDDATGSVSPVIVAMDANKTVTANFAINTLVGKWTFDNPSNLDSASTGSNLTLAGIVNDTNQNDLTAGTQEAIAGPSPENGAVRLGVRSHYNVIHGIAPNGGGTEINQYTMEFDFRIPKLGVWYPLFQTDRYNANDAELYINPTGQIGIMAVGYTPAIVTPGKWYRLTVSVNNGTWLRYYLDGNLIYEGTPQAIDGRFSLDQMVLLFADTDLGDDQIDVAEVNMWDYPLTSPEVAALGMITTQPRAPQSLVVSDSSNQTISLAWQKNEEYDFMRYHIYRGTHPDSTMLVDSTTGGINDTVRTFTGLVSGTRYYFRVTAVDSSNDESSFSNEVSAVYIVQYTILAGAGPGGTIAPSGSVVVNYGAEQQFTVNPNIGYHLQDLLVDGVHQDSTTSYTFYDVDDNHTIDAAFAVNMYSVTATATSGGTIAPSGVTSTPYGSNVQVIFYPDTGYRLTELLVDGIHQDSTVSYTFGNITANHTIHAEFSIITFPIIAVASAGGTITPAGTIDVNYGSSQAFTFGPETGYLFDSLYVDGVHIDSAVSYTFTNVTLPHSIYAKFRMIEYTILAGAGAGGTITPSGAVSVNYGSDQHFTVTPNTGYSLNDLLVDGTHVDSTTSYTFSNVTANHTIVASFTINQMTILASAGTGGTITPSGAVSVNYGADQHFTVTPNTGYSLNDLLVDGTHVDSTTSYTFSNVTANHTIAASFTINQMTITASAGSGGTITPSGAVSVNYGADQHFTIAPNTGYSLNDLLVDGTHVDSTTSYTFSDVTANHTIAASFTINQLTITASAGTGGTITPSGAVSVNYDADQHFIIAPNTGYSLNDLLVDGTHVDSTTSYTFTNVTANHTIAASFTINQLTITATAGTGGTITPSGAVHVSYGEDQEFEIEPNNGYSLSNLLVDGTHVDSTTSYTFYNVTANHTIAASFTANQLTITATAGTGGTITPSGAVSVNYGADQHFTIAPNTGYSLNDLLVDGTHVDSTTSYTFTNVTANHTIAVSFTANQLTITATAGTGGTITPSGAVHVNYGEDQAFEIEPNTGYSLSNLLVDGVHVDSTTSYTFRNVIANHTIAASFTANQLTITATAGTGGTITPSGAVHVNYGEDQAFEIEPNTGYSLSNLLVDGVHADSTTSYTFRNVIANHTIAASFTANQLTITATAGTGGTITPNGAINVTYGADRQFTIAPNTGYLIDSVTVDGDRVDSTTSYTFRNVTENHTIHATFILKTYPITATAGTGGTITPSGTVQVTHGSDQVFAIVPNTGYNIDSVTIDGVRVDSTVSYTFHSVTASHTINAAFVLQQFTIRATAGTGGTITPDGTVTVNYGDSVQFIMQPLAGYVVDSVFVDGVYEGDDTLYTFEDVMANHTIHVTFTVKEGVDDGAGIPTVYALHQNYPNPFNPTTHVQFDLPQQSVVTVTMYNILGKVVSVVVDHQTMNAGYRNITIEGSSLASGMYFYRIEAQGVDGNNFSQVKKMILMK
jgi:hypothetical protein